jgi:transketolase
MFCIDSAKVVKRSN